MNRYSAVGGRIFGKRGGSPSPSLSFFLSYSAGELRPTGASHFSKNLAISVRCSTVATETNAKSTEGTRRRRNRVLAHLSRRIPISRPNAVVLTSMASKESHGRSAVAVMLRTSNPKATSAMTSCVKRAAACGWTERARATIYFTKPSSSSVSATNHQLSEVGYRSCSSACERRTQKRNAASLHVAASSADKHRPGQQSVGPLLPSPKLSLAFMTSPLSAFSPILPQKRSPILRAAGIKRGGEVGQAGG